MEYKTQMRADSGGRNEIWWGDVNSVKNSGCVDFMMPSIGFLEKRQLQDDPSAGGL